MSEVEVGQIWKERDGRFFRLVEVIAIEGDRAVIENYPLTPEGGRRRTRARLDRFGKRYDLWTKKTGLSQ